MTQKYQLALSGEFKPEECRIIFPPRTDDFGITYKTLNTKLRIRVAIKRYLSNNLPANRGIINTAKSQSSQDRFWGRTISVSNQVGENCLKSASFPTPFLKMSERSFNLSEEESPPNPNKFEELLTMDDSEPNANSTNNVEYTNSIGMEFVKIEAGCFYMGRPADEDGDKDEIPRHRVCITQPFLLGKTIVTQKQWLEVMFLNPSHFKGHDNPVDQVDLDGIKRFIKRLNEKEGGDYYRLPTEAEWEYAARAGSNSMYYFGDNKDDLPQYAWFDYNSNEQTHPVAQKKPNQWGLYDMHGNTWEWLQDWFSREYYQESPINDPKGPSSGSLYSARGGCWDNNARSLRSAYRIHVWPDHRGRSLSFRLARRL